RRRPRGLRRSLAAGPRPAGRPAGMVIIVGPHCSVLRLSPPSRGPAHYLIWHTLPFLSNYVIYASVSHETTPLGERPARAVRPPGRPPPARPRRARQRQRRGHRRGRPAFRRGPLPVLPVGTGCHPA